MADSSKKDARISVGVDGADEVAQAANKALNPWTAAADKAKGAASAAGQAIGSAFKQAASDIVRTVTVANTISFGQAMQSARAYREDIARTAASVGRSFDTLKYQIGGIASRKLMRDEDALKFVRTLKGATYDANAAMVAMGGLADEAIATGRGIEEMVPLGALLKNTLGVAGSTADALGTIRAQAEALGTAGGVAAFHDRLVAVSDVLSQISIKSDADRNKVTALVGGLANQGYSPDAARRIVGGMLGTVTRDPRGIERFLGMKRGESLDEMGNVKDPLGLLERYRERVLRHTGGNVALARNIAAGDVGGNQAAAALFATDFNKIRAAAALGPSTSAQAIAGQFAKSEAGEALQAQIDIERNTRQAAEYLLPVADWVQRYSSGVPLLGPLAAGMAGQLGIGAIASAFKALMGTVSVVAPVVAAAPGVAGAGGVVPAVGSAAPGVLGGAVGSAALPVAAGASVVSAAMFYREQAKIRDWDALPNFKKDRIIADGQASAARDMITAFAGSGGTESGWLRAMSPGLRAAADRDPALQVLAQGLLSGDVSLSDLPDAMRAAVVEGIKQSKLEAVVQVSSADGTPIMSVEQSKGKAPSN